MIARIWHGWTTPENADKYENLLKTKIFPGIEAKNLPGYRNISLLRCPKENEVEFITIMHFDSWNDVKAFAGDDYGKAYVPPEGRSVLKRFDNRSQHYEVIHNIQYK